MRRFALLVAALTLAAAGAFATHGPAHDSKTEPVYDGCRRSTGEVLLGTTPEWTYVGAENSPKTVVGTVTSAYVSGEDNPTAHESYDLLFDVDPDPDYEAVLATANPTQLHVEWEENYFPLWALPTGGDRVTVVGNWIWDCGHWGQNVDPRADPEGWIPYAQYGPQFQGESTEIHPPRAVFTVRKNAATAQGAVSRADLFISSDGTPARAQEECQLSVGLNPRPSDPATAVNQDSVEQRAAGAASGCSAWQPVNDRDYTFEMPLPPGTGSVLAEVEVRESENAPAVEVGVDEANGIAKIDVPFTEIGDETTAILRPRMALGATVTLIRENPEPSVGVRVTLSSVTINNDLDTEVPYEQGATAEPSEYNLYADVNGTWISLHEIAPGIGHTGAGQSFPLNSAADVWVPAAAAALRIFAMGRECDLPRMAPCDEDVELSFNESPGQFEWTNTAVFSMPAGLPAVFSGTSSGGTAGCGCFTLLWSVERLP